MFRRIFMDVRISVTVFAVCLAVVGAALVFAPDEATSMLAPGSSHSILVQLSGAALLGWAVAIWTARGALLGGIYGRAIVAGNHMHLTVGAVLLVTHGVNAAVAHPAYWSLAGFYVVGALFF